MATRYSKFTRNVYLAGDLILLNLSFWIAYELKFGDLPVNSQPHYIILILVFNLNWLIATFLLKTYFIERVEQNSLLIKRTLRVFLLHGLMVAGFIVFRKGYYYSREHLLFTYTILTFSLVIWRAACIYFFRLYRSKGYNFRKVIILGANEVGRNLKRSFIKNPHHGYRFMGFFDDRNTQADVVGPVANVKQYVLENEIDEMYCVMSEVKNEVLNDLIEFADNNIVRMRIVPDFREISRKNFKIDLYEDQPILTFREIPLDDVLNQIIKRTFDIFFSLFVIVFIMSWLFPIVAILVKTTSRGPIFFKQQRSGRNNEPFWCWKFRSMYVNKESNLKQATRDDSRITPIGKFLRKTNLDELPQFFNVLIGQMSVVGPRPHMLRHTEEYSQLIDKYMVRHFIKPGITGLAQVKGYRGETTNPVMMKNRIKVDIFYIENWSFLLDLKIIWMTVAGMIKGDKAAF